MAERLAWDQEASGSIPDTLIMGTIEPNYWLDIWSEGIIYEDELVVTDEQYDYLFPYSRVDGVRIFPKLLVDLIGLSLSIL